MKVSLVYGLLVRGGLSAVEETLFFTLSLYGPAVEPTHTPVP